MEIFTAASHNDVLALVTQIAILLFTARALGEIAQRLGQPPVIGELLAGILLGPSFLGKLFPFIIGYVIPEKGVQGYLLEAISLMGAMFLLFITGLETDLQLIRRYAKASMAAAAGGVIVPFAGGFLLGQALPDFLLVNPAQRMIFSLFLATAMSISAIPVLAKILIDLNLMRRNIGQAIIAAGMVDDTIAWILLSIVAGLATGKAVTTLSVLGAFGTVLAFMIVSLTFGRWLVKRSLDFVQDQVTSPHRILTLSVILIFVWGSLTQALHLEPVLGAFVMGILFGQMPRLPQAVRTSLDEITIGIFAPIFFAVAGLKVNLLILFDPQLIVIAFWVILVATAGKVIGTYAGVRLLAHKDHWTALSFGAALNARGAVGIIVAAIGLSLGILSQAMFSIIVVMAMVTSLLAPFFLRWTLKFIKPDEQEVKRLHQEQLTHGSIINKINRVLIPVRNRAAEESADAMHIIKSRLIHNINAKTKISITLLSVGHHGSKDSNNKFLNELSQLFSGQELVKKVVESSNPLSAILDEAHKDYDLIVLGASDKATSSETIFSPLIDSLIQLSPCSTMVVDSKNISDHWSPKRILVPSKGSLAAKHAAEFAYLLAPLQEETVMILNVVVRQANDWHFDIHDDIYRRQVRISQRMVEELKELGELQGVKTSAKVEIGTDPETVILEVAGKENIDLIILGTDVRPASDRLYLGPRVERILRNSPFPVLILNSI